MRAGGCPAACEALPINVLQFHGDEDAGYCRQFSRPYLRAARVRPGLDLVEFAGSFPEARGLLLDAFVEGYGGGGHVFDWTLIPPGPARFLVLSGGLNAENVGDAVRTRAAGGRRCLFRGGNEQGNQGSLENRCLCGGRTESR
jgi:phosphoribosylanthranilate isomerase